MPIHGRLASWQRVNPLRAMDSDVWNTAKTAWIQWEGRWQQIYGQSVMPRVMLHFNYYNFMDRYTGKEFHNVGCSIDSTSGAKFGTTCLNFNRYNNYLWYPSDSSWNIGYEPFCMDCWYYVQTKDLAKPWTVGIQNFLSHGDADLNPGSFIWGLYLVESTTQMFFHIGSIAYGYATLDSVLTYDAWNHFAITRDWDQLMYMYCNGYLCAAWYRPIKMDFDGPLYIGTRPPPGGPGTRPGYQTATSRMDELRILVGEPWWMNNGIYYPSQSFTPPTVPYTYPCSQ